MGSFVCVRIERVGYHFFESLDMEGGNGAGEGCVGGVGVDICEDVGKGAFDIVDEIVLVGGADDADGGMDCGVGVDVVVVITDIAITRNEIGKISRNWTSEDGVGDEFVAFIGPFFEGYASVDVVFGGLYDVLSVWGYQVPECVFVFGVFWMEAAFVVTAVEYLFVEGCVADDTEDEFLECEGIRGGEVDFV